VACINFSTSFHLRLFSFFSSLVLDSAFLSFFLFSTSFAFLLTFLLFSVFPPHILHLQLLALSLSSYFLFSSSNTSPTSFHLCLFSLFSSLVLDSAFLSFFLLSPSFAPFLTFVLFSVLPPHIIHLHLLALSFSSSFLFSSPNTSPSSSLFALFFVCSC